MSNYFYIAIICGVIVSIIIREIYLFSKGKYYPYFNWNAEDSFKKRMVDIGLLIVLWVSFYNLSNLFPKPPIFFSLLLLAFPLCVNILNYLSYAKNKDRKIIYQTLILDISLVAYFLIMECIIRFMIPYTG